MQKGITPIIAMILLVLIVVAIGGAFASWTTTSVQTATKSGSEEVKEQTQKLTTSFVIEGVSENKIYLRNIGVNPITNNSLYVYIGGEKINCSLSENIESGKVGTVELENLWSVSTGKNELKVSGVGCSPILSVEVNPASCIVGYWKFDEGSGTMAKDSSGEGNDGELKNGPVWVDGKFGKALSFDGSDDYVEVPDSASLDEIFGSLNWTLEAWAYPKGWANWASIINKANSGWYSATTSGLWADNSGFEAVIGSNEPGNPPDSVVRVWYKPPLNNWYHLVAVANGTHIPLFVNGENKGTKAITNYIKTHLTSNDAPVTIGRRCTGCSPSFNGIIDEVRIYNRALTPKDLLVLSES